MANDKTWVPSDIYGEIFLDSKKYPDATGRINDHPIINDNNAGYGSPDQKINIEEAIGKVYKILDAGTALSAALYMNIQQFAPALETGHALQLCQDTMKAMQKQIDELNKKVDRLTSVPTTSGGQGDGSEEKMA